MSISKPLPNDIVKRTYEEMKFSDCLYQRVDISKVNLERLKPWINRKIAKYLTVENKVVTEFVCNQLQKEKLPCPKQLHINMTGFLTAHQAQEFMDELWALLISAEESENGIPAKFLKENTNENNTKSSIRECQSTKGNKNELSDGEIHESRSSSNGSWDRSERNRSSPNREMNDSHGKQSQRRSRSANRRSPEHTNQRYRSRYRNARRYESPQRRRDILWSRNRQSRSRFEEKHKTSSSFIMASAKRNRSKSRDSYDTHNGYINGDTIARNPCNPFAKRFASRSPSKDYAAASYLPSEIHIRYRSSSKHSNYKRRASRSVSFTPSPERLQNNRGYNRDSSANSLERDNGRFNGGRRDDSRSSVRGSEYNRYRPDRYNRQSSNRSRSPRRFNGRHCPFRGNNGRRSNRWNRKRQCRERFRDGYDQQGYISPQRRFSREQHFSPRHNEFRRISPQCRESPQRLSPERRSDLKEQNISSPLQVYTPEHEDQTKNSTVTMQSPKQSPSSSNTIHKESQDTRAEKRKYCALEESPVVDSNNDNNSAAEEKYLAKKKHKKTKHNSDDYASEVASSKEKKHKKHSSKKRDRKYKEENKEPKVLDSNDDDNLENTQSELSCTESNMFDIFDENLEENLENMTIA